MRAHFSKQCSPLRDSSVSRPPAQSSFRLRCCFLVQQNPRKLQTGPGLPNLAVPAVQQVHVGEPLALSMHADYSHAKERDLSFPCLEQPPQRHGRLGCLPSGSAGLSGH